MASLRFAINWIAQNEEPLDMDVRSVSADVCVLLIADTFGKSPEYVARAVIRRRRAANGKPDCRCFPRCASEEQHRRNLRNARAQKAHLASQHTAPNGAA